MEQIIIIGAGAAGLMAARELSAKNHVIVLEGDNRLGGRIHTIENEGFTGTVEAGAEFIHGNLQLTLQLVREAGAEIVETGGAMHSSRDGKWVERETMPGGWADMMKRMNTLQEDITLNDFLCKFYSGEKYAKLCDRARGYAQGYDVADPAKVSVFFLRDEWGQGWDDQYRITGGYGKMITYLADECIKNGAEINTGAAVNKIEWSKNTVTVSTLNGHQYHGRKAVITVPVSVLQQTGAKANIRFEPSIDNYIKTAGHIGYGGVIKIVLEFKTAFWNDHKGGVGFMFCDQFIPTWWTQAPDGTPVITGWLGGPKADALVDSADETILEKSLEALTRVFGIPADTLRGELVAGKVFNWPANQFSLGAYSYATPLTTQALEVFKTPVEDTLYFAGEALYSGAHPGTVEAALVSGKEVADKILHAVHSMS